MITSNPNEFWNRVGNQPDYMAFVYPKRTEEECDNEGCAQAQLLSEFLKAPGVCIDYGCGVGRVTKHFKPYATKMIGLDICKKFVELAREADKESEYFVVSDFNTENVADFIFCLSVLQHNDKLGQEKIMDDIYRLLKPGGKCVVYFASGNAYTESEFIHKFTEDEINGLAKQFSRVKIQDGNLFCYGGRTIQPGEYNEKILIAIK